MFRTVALLLAATPLLGQTNRGWWMEEPLRWVQTNLRETDANLDVQKLMAELEGMRANVLHFGMGGIAAYYPTRVEFHYPSPYLPAGRDLFGEVLREAHKRKIRVVGRFDLSKTRKEVYDRHPEWFFRKADGSPVIYNGLYSVCINGGYYREQAMKILGEALDRYEVDGLFFNMFGNQSRDYSGVFVGNCHCDNCRRLYGKEIPQDTNEEYRQFLFRSSREMAAEIGKLIRAKRPQAGYFNYIQEHTDGIMSESNTAISRPLPLWPYASSDNVNRARNSQPGKMSVNLCMQFVDYAWRFATVPPQEIALRLWQNVSHGGAAAFSINGTFEQADRQAIETARPVFQWLAEHEAYYRGQQNAARVLLLGGSAGTGRTFSQASYRGMFRLLSEEHIPFAVSDNLDWIGQRQFDLVIATDWAPAAVSRYVEDGGRVLVASAEAPEFGGVAIAKRWPRVEGYWRVRKPAWFPSLKATNLLMLDGPYSEPAQADATVLTLVPPSMIGPPEKIHTDQVESDKPGLVRTPIGKGEMIWLPWDAAGLYYRYSLPAHAGLLRDLVDRLLDGQRQIRTDAHPLVEVSLMRQGQRTLLHLNNLSGHSGTAYHAPIPMTNLRIVMAGGLGDAKAIRAGIAVKSRRIGKETELVLPQLKDYELLVFEPLKKN